MKKFTERDSHVRPEFSSATDAKTSRRLHYLLQVIERAAELLPSQGPITSFVFQNTLQALEDLPFEEGVVKGARLFGCQPYLSEDQYRAAWFKERIQTHDIESILWGTLGDRAGKRVGPIGTRFDLRMAMLRFPLLHGPSDELRWFVVETDALTRLRSEVPSLVRHQFLSETRRWVMKGVCAAIAHRKEPALHTQDPRVYELLGDLLKKLGEEKIELWADAEWESLSVQALWRLCRRGVHGLDTLAQSALPSIRHRDALLAATGADSDELVHEVLIRFCAAFTDQGFAQWPLPHRRHGLFQAFVTLFGTVEKSAPHWMQALPHELARIRSTRFGPLDSIAESLELLGVPEDEWDDYLTATLLALRGWAGMIRQMELRGDRFAKSAPANSLLEYLAVRLILERLAIKHLAIHTRHYDGPLANLRDNARRSVPKSEIASIEQRAFPVFQLAQILGWSPPALIRLSKKEWSNLVAEIESFSSIERRRLFQLAFERRLRIRTLDAISIHSQQSAEPLPTPQFQAVFCVDTREESFRRHLEELAPQVETFGAAGFFGVPIYYRGAAEAHFTALCPIMMKPRYWVEEQVVFPLEDTHRRRAKTRRWLGSTSRQVHLRSRGIASGALLTAGLGILASIPLVARVLFPGLTARVRRTAGEMLNPPPLTRLRLERTANEPGAREDQIGFTVSEMADIAERFLRDIGLTNRFAPIILFVGHGSSCLNNPHQSAYDCGACSGSAGAPNARVMASILNKSRVRRILEERGISIPDTTRFLGGLHNTTNDSISFFDLDLLPINSVEEFRTAREKLEQACERNAHERCRRFYSAPLNLSPAAARRHVQNRSEDLSQTRPEFGNATNAVCFVGRRSRTRGLYLDRRSFLVSYDPTQDDPQQTVLNRILSAVVPVCEGINLQYYFSRVDPTGWGCGTKLPHNITSLLGVMDGPASDLRTGLPWQGVEIHEPVRLLVVIEATPEALTHVMNDNELLGRVLENGWVQLAALNPDSSQIYVYHDQQFQVYEPESKVLPNAKSSLAWYRGWREHLPFATIGKSLE
jgi:uncharacterized protein YbcC (UPF0753/DUF2309 family)